MKINITFNKTLKEIQSEFQNYFPHLKIEFYHKIHKKGEGSENDSELDNNLTVAEVNLLIENSVWEFSSETKVSELEDEFKNLTKFSTQVFRKTKSSWIQTIATDDWTLNEQELEAIEMCSDINKEDPIDYHEQE
jgi:hypothetical protein